MDEMPDKQTFTVLDGLYRVRVKIRLGTLANQSQGRGYNGESGPKGVRKGH
jgi:hypothetical protein